MINKGTGYVFLDTGDVVRLGLKKADFIKLKFRNEKPLVRRKSWWSSTTHEVRISGNVYILTTYFDKEILNMIHLFSDEPKSDVWSEETERKRQSIHDDLIEQTLGNQRKFPWGTVWSGYDEKAGFSLIVIR